MRGPGPAVTEDGGGRQGAHCYLHPRLPPCCAGVPHHGRHPRVLQAEVSLLAVRAMCAASRSQEGSHEACSRRVLCRRIRHAQIGGRGRQARRSLPAHRIIRAPPASPPPPACSALLAFGADSKALQEGRAATIQCLSGTGSLRVRPPEGGVLAGRCGAGQQGWQARCGGAWPLPPSGGPQLSVATTQPCTLPFAGGRRVPGSLLLPQAGADPHPLLGHPQGW